MDENRINRITNERVGVLDVGSNSVRLLVAQIAAGGVSTVFVDKITSRLLSGMKDGYLAAESLNRTADAIQSLTRAAREQGAKNVYGFGTSAMRDGRNSAQLIERAATFGVELRVLSGVEEAELAYAGAAPQGKCLVLDIGGGSTEMLAGENGHVARAYSARVGAVRLWEEIGLDDPDALRDRARAILLPGWAQICAIPFERVVGVGGTITALAAMSQNLSVYDADKVTGFYLDARRVQDWLRHLCALSQDERARLPGLNPQRADIIPAGAAILSAFFDLAGAEGLYASDRDNLLGYIKSEILPRV